MNNSILIIGGDKRQERLYKLLSDKSYDCIKENRASNNGLSEIKRHRIIVLPIPFSADGQHIYSNNPDFKLSVSDLIKELSAEHTVITGGISEKIRNRMIEANIKFLDMTEIDYFTEYNAFLTSQGALKLLLDNTQELVTGKKVIVTGFGRVAEALAYTLKGIGADVFILARNYNRLMRAHCLGFKTVDFSAKSSVLCMFDFIFNTVPSPIFSDADIFRIREDAVYFELASKPYGADKTSFEKYNKKYINGGGLPGKYVSDSAADIMADFIINTVKESFL